MSPSRLSLVLIAGLGLGTSPALVAAEIPAKPEPAAVAPVTLTGDQKTALAAVDARLKGVEAIIAKVDDPDYKIECVKSLEDLTKRKVALEKNFDQGLHEALMHSVISRYQVVALWLTPPRVPLPAGRIANPIMKPKPNKGPSDNAPGTY